VKPSKDDLASFRGALGAELPDYMLPHHVVVLPAMPLTVNGKLDRNRLKDMPWDTQLGSAGRAPPESERERQVAAVFARVLGVGLGDVGAEDSFFDLGGDSLLGVVALEQIERAIGAKVPPDVLFETGTVRALAGYTPGQIAGSGGPRPVLLNAKTSGPPLFVLSGIHIYRALARRLDGRCSVYGMFTRREVGAFDPASAQGDIDDLARDYLEIIRSKQPTGPYRLLGYSFAGMVAYEVAQRLRAAGEEVRLLALVDTELPEWVFPLRYRLGQLSRIPGANRRALVASLYHRLLVKLGLRRADFFEGPREDWRVAMEDLRGAVNRDAAEQYMARLRPFSGKVTLITSAERVRVDPLQSPSGGWSRFVPSLDLHAIDADHFRMMSDDPYVSQIADILVNRIQEAEATARPVNSGRRAAAA
jgi:thioesterase domain-containing protein/acyl carrier protein